MHYRNEGHKAYIIPAGGSSTLGAWGYIDGFDEMMKQVANIFKFLLLIVVYAHVYANMCIHEFMYIYVLCYSMHWITLKTLGRICKAYV